MSTTPVDPTTPAPAQAPASATATPPEPPAQAPTGQTGEGDNPPNGNDVDWKAMSRLWEARAKENSAAAKKLKDLEDAAKTAEERQAEENAELRRQIQTYEQATQRAAWLSQIQQTTGLPADIIGALKGDTLEELTAAANTVKAHIAASNKPQPVPNEGRLPRVDTTPTKPGLGTLEEAYANKT